MRLRPLARPFRSYYSNVVKTRPGICQKKRRFASREEAEQVALRADAPLRAYKCALCKRFHLTSRTKGLRVPRGVNGDAGSGKGSPCIPPRCD